MKLVIATAHRFGHYIVPLNARWDTPTLKLLLQPFYPKCVSLQRLRVESGDPTTGMMSTGNPHLGQEFFLHPFSSMTPLSFWFLLTLHHVWSFCPKLSKAKEKEREPQQGLGEGVKEYHKPQLAPLSLPTGYSSAAQKAELLFLHKLSVAYHDCIFPVSPIMHRETRSQKLPGKLGCSINSWFLTGVRLPAAFYGFSAWPSLPSPVAVSTLSLHTETLCLQSVIQSCKHLNHSSQMDPPAHHQWVQCQWGHTQPKQSWPSSCSSANPFPCPLHFPPLLQ